MWAWTLTETKEVRHLAEISSMTHVFRSLFALAHPLLYPKVSKKRKQKHHSIGPKRSKCLKQTPAVECECRLVSNPFFWDGSDLDIESLKVFCSGPPSDSMTSSATGSTLSTLQSSFDRDLFTTSFGLCAESKKTTCTST